jgi:hypothetical protein
VPVLLDCSAPDLGDAATAAYVRITGGANLPATAGAPPAASRTARRGSHPTLAPAQPSSARRHWQQMQARCTGQSVRASDLAGRALGL